MGEMYHLSAETVDLIQEIKLMEAVIGPIRDEAIIHRALALYLGTSNDLYNESDLRPEDWCLLPLRESEVRELEERVGDILKEILHEEITVEGEFDEVE